MHRMRTDSLHDARAYMRQCCVPLRASEKVLLEKKRRLHGEKKIFKMLLYINVNVY